MTPPRLFVAGEGDIADDLLCAMIVESSMSMGYDCGEAAVVWIALLASGIPGSLLCTRTAVFSDARTPIRRF